MAAILQRLAEDARAAGLSQLELQVVVGNTAAITAYERVGYRRVGMIPRSIREAGKDYDEDLMVLTLDP